MPAGLTYSEAAALLVIHRGVDTVKGVAEALQVSTSEAERIVASLEAKGLVERVRKGLIFKRERLRLTKRGLDAVPEALEILKRASEAAVKAAEEARSGREAPPLEPDILAVLPAMAFLNLIPAWVVGTLLPALALGEAAEGDWEPPSGDDMDQVDADLDAGDWDAEM
ncbi:MarR family transcriptional regulator [Stetteria hydrogenophila]